jgi:hypothetical protein
MIPKKSCAIAAALACSLAASSAFAAPDLVLDESAMRSSAAIDYEIFEEPGDPVPLDSVAPISGNCVLDPSELCAGGPGIRKLLRFDVKVDNRGDEDLVIGDPRELPELFDYSACHGHYHFAQASRYELLDAAGTVVATGRKQGFCLEDTNPLSPATQHPRRYNCEFQGISVGYADVYPAELDCQWIDVTDLPAGDYTLHVVWNPEGLLSEATRENNEGSVAIEIPEATDAPPVVDRVLRPARSTVAQVGRDLRITWTASDDEAITSQEVWYSLDDGATWEQIAGAIPGNERSFVWPVPLSVASDAARIRVVARDASADKGQAESGRFRIKKGVRRLAARP